MFLKSNNKSVRPCKNNSGFNDLKEFLDYLIQYKKTFKVMIDNNNNWTCSVGSFAIKKHFKEMQNDDEQQNEQ